LNSGILKSGIWHLKSVIGKFRFGDFKMPDARCPISRFPAICPVLLVVLFSLQASRLLAARAPAAGAGPTLDHIYPVAVQIGTTTEITAVGKFAPWPPKMWTDAPGISFRAEKTTGKFSVEVAAGAPVGPHLIRVFNETGASAPRFLIVAADAQISETEPNDDFAKVPVIDRLPASINGRLNKSGDVDSYAVKLDAGQTLLASIEAYVLASPVDAVLRLVDSRGLEVALNHDNGRTLDPLLAWTAKVAGTYVVQVFGFAYPATADVKFTGSDACVYRLHLTRGTQMKTTLPFPAGDGPQMREVDSAWSRGAPAAVIEENATHSTSSEQARAPHPHEKFGLAPPFAVTGCIEKIGEEDRYNFSAVKDEKLILEIQSAKFGFPLDAWLAIHDDAGKELVKNDDGTSADPVLEWTAPATSTYVAVVGSVLHRAGADHLYRLSIQRAQPAFNAVIAESGFTIEPGKSVKIKVTAKHLHGFKTKLTATVTGLPEGVTASPVELGEAEKEISLDLKAAADAAPFSGPVEIALRADKSDTMYPAVHELISTSSRNGVPGGFRDLVINATDKLWLTVLSAPPLSKVAKPAEAAEEK
jgi:hypothetical protein